ncbi:hypothetical protein D0437_33405 [Bacillus cereus]|uniref:Uncharacterized protein n=1 Tax=Bacillus cereus TaxID=1396 RepID=A0A9X7M2K4_BACCE|nr:hypothetical protein D0437_33405 [Bacillus cereus]
MIYGKMISWRTHKEFIIFELNHENNYIELIIYKHWIFNIEQINGGKYILFDNFKKEVFII